jgi:dTDP-4-dehydrorhamnose 3,5-epimerase
MKFVPLELEGAYVVELEPHADERGSFARVWCHDEFAEHGLTSQLAQCSVSRNTRKGTLRGLHYQRSPHEEAKLVRCIRGAVFDVIVDLRASSATAGSWVGVELDAATGRAVYVPEGFAHGFQTLTDDTELLYMISHPYAPEAAAGVRWDDPALNVDWPDVDSRTISDRDLALPDLEQAVGR